jgi:hypothetical protein
MPAQAPGAAPSTVRMSMPRKPNYRFERQERERLKAAKKAEKLAKKQASDETTPPEGQAPAQATPESTS